MIDTLSHSVRSSHRRVAALLFAAAALFVGNIARAQTPSLQISAPENGTIVQPGSVVPVTVVSPSGTTFSQVVVVAQNPVDLLAFSPTLPFQTSANVPTALALRRYQLNATGRTPNGQEVDASAIVIDVERSDMPSGLVLNTTSMRFEAPGGILPSTCSPASRMAPTSTPPSRLASRIAWPIPRWPA